MKVLVTGSKGQLGLSIQEKAKAFPDLQFIYKDIDELDISDVNSLRFFFRQNKINALINCAGYTAVDKAETEQETAYLINARAVQHLAVLSKEFEFTIIHISTDFVFNGKKTTEYTESDIPLPLSIYGQSKLEGEKNITVFAENGLIIRTSWLYSEFGNNFLKTIRKIASERDQIKVVNDQTGTPTYAGDLAEAILNILKQSVIKGVIIYHYSNEGAISWFDFAKSIIRLSRLNCKVIPIPSTEYPLPAKRPSFSVLSKEKIKKDYGLKIPNWEESLKFCIDKLEKGF